MKLAILGYGIEGKSVEKYFKTHPYDNIAPKDIEITVFNEFTTDDLEHGELSVKLQDFDVIFRSPSVRPTYDYKKHDGSDNPSESAYLKNKPYWTSATKYFFDHCPAEIISVTGTKGKGTTCSMITALVESVNAQIFPDESTRPHTYLVGNIGIAPLDVLDQITEHDNVVFEMSSFQLWDLHKSSAVSVILRIEPDHLNVHKDFDEYVYAKAALARYKSKDDFLVYYKDNPVTKQVAESSAAHKLPYPVKNKSDKLKALLNALTIPGDHNKENAEAALLAVAARFFGGDLNSMIDSEVYPALEQGLHEFTGLPHRCQFLRELNNVKYYDDNYSSALPALDVALKAFETYPTVLIAGGYSKGTDAEIKERIFSAKNLKKAILIGSTAKILAEGEDESRYELADSLEDAITRARTIAEAVATKDSPAVVLMSPGFASFDMFKNFADRGEKYTNLVKGLK